MSEFFIRYPNSEEAKGPYNIEQLQSLSEAKKVKPDTLYYDEDKEVWVAVGSNSDLNELLFPAEGCGCTREVLNTSAAGGLPAIQSATLLLSQVRRRWASWNL